MVLGEGANKCVLKDVIGEVGFKLKSMAEEVRTVGADPTDAKELAIGETLASMEGMARLESEVVMDICGFGLEVYPEGAVRFKVNHGIQEGKVGGGNFEGEFNGGMAGVEVVDEGQEGHEAMLPDEEGVIYEPFPQEGQEAVRIGMELLKSMHVSICIVRGSSGAYGSTPQLEEMSATEGEVVAAEDKFEEFNEGGVGRVLGSRPDGFQSFKCFLDSLGVGYIGIDAAYVQSD